MIVNVHHERQRYWPFDFLEKPKEKLSELQPNNSHVDKKPTLAYFSGQGYPYISYLKKVLSEAFHNIHAPLACSSFEERHSRTELGYATADIFRENLQLLDAERDCVDTNTLTADNFPSFLDTFACFEHNHAARIFNAVELPIDHLASAQM